MSVTIVNMPFSDNKAITRLHEMLESAILFWERFQEEDPTIFNDDFITRCRLAINRLHSMRRDSTIRSIGKSSTLFKDNYLMTAMDLWSRLKLRLKKAQLQTTDNLLAIFGANDYAECIQNPLKMVTFWKNVESQFASGNHNEAFQNIYIPPQLLIDIQQNRSDLDAIWRAMADFPVFRLNQTIERNQRRAELMDCLRTIADFGKIIFRQQIEYKFFVIRRGTYKPKPTHLLAANSIHSIVVPQLDLSSVLKIKNVGMSDVVVYAVENVDAPMPAATVVVKAGKDAIVSVSHITVVGVPKVLVIWNSGHRRARIRLDIDH